MNDAERTAWRQRDAGAVIWARESAGFIASCSWEQWRDSWAGQEWIRRHRDEIELFAQQQEWRLGGIWKRP